MAHKYEIETHKTFIWQTENIHPIFTFYKIPTSSINSLFPISSLSSCVKYDIDLKAKKRKKNITIGKMNFKSNFQSSDRLADTSRVYDSLTTINYKHTLGIMLTVLLLDKGAEICSGEKACLLPMWSQFNSGPVPLMVEFIIITSRLAPRFFYWVQYFSSLHKKVNITKFHFGQNRGPA